MDYNTKLQTWKKKTIEKKELATLFEISSEEDLYRIVNPLVELGILTPVKSSGTNGNRIYPIQLKYKISIKADYSGALNEIEYLHPSLKASGILQNKPEFYIKHKTNFILLSKYLFSNENHVSISKKELSFEIFGEEKVLDDSSFRSLLDRLGLTSNKLGYYETPEYCFNDYIPERKTKMTLLICENKDIWFNIRRRMYENQAKTIFGTSIDGVVYGAGNRVSEKKALSSYSKFMGCDNITYLYWGDIDRAGLNIYLSLKKNNQSEHIELFIPAYEKMLKLAKEGVVPDSMDNRGITCDYSDIEMLFTGDLKDFLKKCINDNKRIPQEIINYRILLEDMR